MSARTWLAVDGGQSEIRLRLGPEGREARTPGVRHRPGGPAAGMLASLREGLEALGRPRVETAVLGMSGLPHEPAQLTGLAEGVTAASGARDVLLTGDHVTSHAGAFLGMPGVVAAVGTGVAVLGLAPSGGLRRVDGRGYLLGDDGSAFQLGVRGLRAVLGHTEGLGPPTALSEAARERYGPLLAIPQAIYHSASPVDDIARFAQDVLAAAHRGDAVAVALVRDAMSKVARSVAAAARDFGDEDPVPVVVLGGLMRAEKLLRPLLEEALRNLLPAARLCEAAGGGLDGAGWLAAHGAGVYAAETHLYPSRPAAAQPPARPDRGEG